MSKPSKGVANVDIRDSVSPVIVLVSDSGASGTSTGPFSWEVTVVRAVAGSAARVMLADW